MLHENGTESKLGKHTANRCGCSTVALGCGINGIGCWNKQCRAAKLRNVCSAACSASVRSRSSGNQRCAIGVPAEFQFLWESSTIFKTASAAGCRCVLSLENRMSAHGSLSTVVRRIRRRKACADEVGGMAPYRRHAFIRNILSVCRRKPEPGSELRSCKLRERFINSHLTPRNHQPFLMIRPIISFIFSASCDREGNVSDAKADTVGCVLEYWGACFGISTLRRRSWVKIATAIGVRTVCIG